MSESDSSQTAPQDHQGLHMHLLADLAQDLSDKMSFPNSLDLAIRMRSTWLLNDSVKNQTPGQLNLPLNFW